MPGFAALMYHEIVPDGTLPEAGRPIQVASGYEDVLPSRLFVEESTFAAHLEWLAELGATVVTAADIRRFYLDGVPLPPVAILLTVDDLYHSALDLVLPGLASAGLEAVGFVVRDWVFDAPQPRDPSRSVALSWPELDQLRPTFTLANHSASLHVRADDGPVLLRTDRASLEKDTRAAGAAVDEPRVYAYPFGAWSPDRAEWLRSAGVDIAFTTEPGRSTATTSRFSLRRFLVSNQTTRDEFARMIEDEENR